MASGKQTTTHGLRRPQRVEMLSEVVPGLTLYWLAKLEGLARMNELAKKSAEEGKNPDFNSALRFLNCST